MRLTAFAVFAAAAFAGVQAAEYEGAETQLLDDFWSKFDGWKWNCSSYPTKEAEGMQVNTENAGEEPQWLAEEWVNKMMFVRYNKAENISDAETGKLSKMWAICDWFKPKMHKNHTTHGFLADAEFAETEAAVDEAASETAEKEFLYDFWKKCSAWKLDKKWGFNKANYTWLKTGN